MAIQYVEMVAKLYNWTDELKERVIQAVEDKYLRVTSSTAMYLN